MVIQYIYEFSRYEGHTSNKYTNWIRVFYVQKGHKIQFLNLFFFCNLYYNTILINNNFYISTIILIILKTRFYKDKQWFNQKSY